MKFISTAYVTLAVCFCDNVITFPDKNASAAVIDKWTHNGTIFSGYLYQSVCNDITIGENLAKKLKTIFQSFSKNVIMQTNTKRGNNHEHPNGQRMPSLSAEAAFDRGG